MQELISLLNEKVLFGFLLLLGRLLAFVFFMPVFGHSSVPKTLRISLAFFMAIFLFPLVDIKGNFSHGNFILSLICEITLGFIAAIFVNIVFAAIRIIGDFVGYATALSMANIFNPSTNANEGLISRFLYLVALVVFFESGMYEMTIVILVKSFSIIHLGTFNIFSYNGVKIAIDEINRMFAFAFSFSLPLFFIAFIMDIYYGYGTKSMPAFSPFVITFQLKFALIFLFLILGMEIFTQNFVNFLISKFE